MLIKENKNYTALIQENGLRCWIKTAINKCLDGEIIDVVTSLVVTSENNTKDIKYKISAYKSYIITYNNLVDNIESILYYIANTETDEYFRNLYLNEAIINNSFYKIKIACKNIKQDLDNKKVAEEYQKHVQESNKLKNKIIEKSKLLKDIKLILPTEYNNYTYTFILDRNTAKSFNISYNNYETEIKSYKDILNYIDQII